MKNLAIIIWLCLLAFTINAFGQKTKKTAAKFSSQYSNLNSDCKTLAGGSEGTDESSDCKGIGGYRVYVGAAAALVHILARTPDKKDTIQLATQDFDFKESTVKIEWRMTGGKLCHYYARFRLRRRGRGRRVFRKKDRRSIDCQRLAGL